MHSIGKFYGCQLIHENHKNFLTEMICNIRLLAIHEFYSKDVTDQIKGRYRVITTYNITDTIYVAILQYYQYRNSFDTLLIKHFGGFWG